MNPSPTNDVLGNIREPLPLLRSPLGAKHSLRMAKQHSHVFKMLRPYVGIPQVKSEAYLDEDILPPFVTSGSETEPDLRVMSSA